MLRDYQQRAIDQLYEWFEAGNEGHPCLVLPTGSGKSHIIAALCRDAIQKWPETRILMLTHVKELIEQNASKLRQCWPNAPMGIYSASIRKKQLGEPITFAGIQSIRDKAEMIGHVDLIIIDEAHLVNHEDSGSYRELIADLQKINPYLRVIGLTATPFRLGHGLITDPPAIFSALIEPVTIEELIFGGYLAPLRSKVTATKLDTNGVHKRGGEFIESELQAAVDKEDINESVVREIINIAGDRKAWLIFCVGVSHAMHIRDILVKNGINAECVTGRTPKHERERIIDGFKRGEIRALTNANILTTGFDHPDIDLIAMLRPTMSPGLYMQMAGRGMRLKSHTDHCLVLDFAGVVEMHGPITAVRKPKKNNSGCAAPTKVCKECGEICHLSVRECPSCGFAFSISEKEAPNFQLRNDDILGIEASTMLVTGWRWRVHTSRKTGKDMLKCVYYGELSDTPVTEYLPVLHEGYAGQKAMHTLFVIARASGASLADAINLDSRDALEYIANQMNCSPPPSFIEYKMDGKFYKIMRRSWNEKDSNTTVV